MSDLKSAYLELGFTSPSCLEVPGAQQQRASGRQRFKRPASESGDGSRVQTRRVAARGEAGSTPRSAAAPAVAAVAAAPPPLFVGGMPVGVALHPLRAAFVGVGKGGARPGAAPVGPPAGASDLMGTLSGYFGAAPSPHPASERPWWEAAPGQTLQPVKKGVQDLDTGFGAFL